MAKATKEALQNMQKFFDYLGQHGGTIETKESGTSWKFTLQVEKEEKGSKKILVGLCKLFGEGIFADLLYDPLFSVTLQMDGQIIIDGEIKGCINQTVFGTTEIDGNDMLHGFGMTEKASPGLQETFSIFMQNVINLGYLTDPNEVVRYDK